MPSKGIKPKNFKECQKKAWKSNKGRRHSDETKRKMSISHKGINTWMKGRKLTEEHKKNIGKAHKGMERSEKFKKKLSIRMLGNKLNLGKKRSDETKNKIRGENNPFFGKKHTMETRLKIKEARKRQVIPMNDTSIEIKIQNFLKELGFSYFTHNYINIKHGYQCDIFIPFFKIVIECDGDYWHKYPVGRDIDRIRTQELIEKGFKVLRLWEHEIKRMNIIDFQDKVYNLYKI